MRLQRRHPLTIAIILLFFTLLSNFFVDRASPLITVSANNDFIEGLAPNTNNTLWYREFDTSAGIDIYPGYFYRENGNIFLSPYYRDSSSGTFLGGFVFKYNYDEGNSMEESNNLRLIPRL